MQVLFTSWTDALLPVSTYLVLGLCALGAVAWKRRGRWPHVVRWAALVLSVWAWVFSTPAVANLLIRHLEGPLPGATGFPTAVKIAETGTPLILVMASGDVSTRGGRARARLDTPGWERLLAGVALWRHGGGRLLFTAGTDEAGSAETSLAQRMAEHARALGVPPSAIVVKSGATRTREELEVAAPLMRSHAGPVWLVTSAMHMPRTLAVARRLGLEVRPHPCDYRQLEHPAWGAWLPNAGGPALFAEALHEVLGLMVYRVRGWA